MRTILSINQDWLYKPSFLEDRDLNGTIDAADYQPVCLPHTNIELPYNYFSDEAFRFVSCYRRALRLEPEWAGQRLFLDFKGGDLRPDAG